MAANPAFTEDQQLANPLIKKFADNPAICFLELTYLRLKNSSAYQSKIEQYTDKFPEYALIKICILLIYTDWF